MMGYLRLKIRVRVIVDSADTWNFNVSIKIFSKTKKLYETNFFSSHKWPRKSVLGNKLGGQKSCTVQLESNTLAPICHVS